MGKLFRFGTQRPIGCDLPPGLVHWQTGDRHSMWECWQEFVGSLEERLCLVFGLDKDGDGKQSCGRLLGLFLPPKSLAPTMAK
eukprot:12890628-Prorocentrum_lima.AAC.1